ncbi:site-specific DNA-methyltransferase [Pediococcus pentosaceus]|uniref:site-specific DNA-methyltransferase n=1 Tax=Pediococcus pentosaceus TaxID=1255 RepID=UPI003B509002
MTNERTNERLEEVSSHSLDITEQNIEKLKELFPEVLTEKKIDFDKLRLILGDEVETAPERYSFTWNGKKQAMQLAQQPTVATLKPNKAKSKNWDETQNLYIEGDNLEVLKILQKSYANKVKVIYLDPPYNTGRDFVYKDNFRDSIENYLIQTGQKNVDGDVYSTNVDTSGRFHTDWLNMIYSRLKLSRNLLTSDGVIFVSIDETESANLRKVMDELYGENNFVGNIIWQSRTSISNDGEISLNHNHTLVYSKNRKELLFGGDDIDSSEYVNNDNDPRGPWKLVPIDANHPGGETAYPIRNPKTGAEYLPPNNRIWAYNQQTFEKLLEDGRIKFGMNDDSSPKRKLYLQERIDRGDVKTPSSISLEAGTTQSGTREIMSLFDNSKVFDYPKPSSFVKKLVKYGTFQTPNALVLDFFSGSSSTADAVMQLNSEDDYNRKFIMVQLPEMTDSKTVANKLGYSTIPEIAEERIRRAGDKIVEENPLLADKLDIGFKVFELSKSNIKKWNAEPKDLNEQFELLANNFEEGSKSIDVVYEIMLKQGLDLTYPIREIKVGDAVVYDIAFGAMFVVLGDKITSEMAGHIMKQIADEEAENSVVVLQDEKFINDSEKLNTIEQLNASGIQYNDILSI